MILNSLPIDPPPDLEHPDSDDEDLEFFAYFTQDNFFSDTVERIITEEEVIQKGFTLEQLGDALTAWEYGCTCDELK